MRLGRRRNGKGRRWKISVHCEHVLLSFWRRCGPCFRVTPRPGTGSWGIYPPALHSSRVEGYSGAVPSPALLIGTSNMLCSGRGFSHCQTKKALGRRFEKGTSGGGGSLADHREATVAQLDSTCSEATGEGRLTSS